MVIAMATATATTIMTKGGLLLHVPAMCSIVAGETLCLHPYGHKGKCIHQRCVMGVTLLKVFAPFEGGGFLTAHHGLFFCLFFTTTVQFTEQPSVCPPHYSGAQEPCQPIDTLPPPLLQEPCLVESVSSASILHCQSYLQECISRRGLLHYSEGSVFVMR
jgi:hypothetical protein